MTLAQVHAALGYYYDHKSELDRQIKQQRRRSDDLAAKFAGTPLARELRKAMTAARRKAS